MGDTHLGEMPQLEYFIKGLCRLSPGHSYSRSYPDILRYHRVSWEKNGNTLRWGNVGNSMYVLFCFVFFLCLLRCGEVVVPSESAFDDSSHLAAGDVRVDSTSDPHYLQVNIKASKTDPFRQDVFVYLGRTNVDVYPVVNILAYMVLRGSAPGPFFNLLMGDT